MLESFLEIDGEFHFLRHTPLSPQRRTLLLIHGLGESSLSFQEAFQHLNASAWNIVAPDNIGYGRSSAARDGDYAFLRQIARLQRLLSRLSLDEVVLVGHSLGGMLGTLWMHRPDGERILGLINIEGNLTPSDATFSRLAAEAYETCDRNFKRWKLWFYGDFLNQQVLVDPACAALRRYHASILFSRPEAFLQNAREILARTICEEGQESEMTRLYASANIPTRYCWGNQSLSQATRDFLGARNLAECGFMRSGHWPMIDEPEDFYQAVDAFLNEVPR